MEVLQKFGDGVAGAGTVDNLANRHSVDAVMRVVRAGKAVVHGGVAHIGVAHVLPVVHGGVVHGRVVHGGVAHIGVARIGVRRGPISGLTSSLEEPVGRKIVEMMTKT